MSTVAPNNQYDIQITVDAGQGAGTNSATLVGAFEKTGGRARLFTWATSWGSTTAKLQVNPTPDGAAGPWTDLSTAITADNSQVVEIPRGCSLRLNTAGGTGTGIKATLVPLP